MGASARGATAPWRSTVVARTPSSPSWRSWRSRELRSWLSPRSAARAPLARGGSTRGVVAPIDGSLNARRTIPFHSLSIAVASGPSMADVEFGFVHDFGADEEFAARRGEGATLDGAPVRVCPEGEKLEVVGLESAEPEWTLPALEELAGKAYRLGGVGSIGITRAHVGWGR